ncbi:hypothetical protein [Aquimarina sp. RZ0]|uniref:hypothetical protein n=1 Tax=Aquimarina sp. RZ0 TaxID=2607730 RepID=UPI0011F3BAA3|nr:hypothetical protein [Aquimarina sp. RZ0]KAA1242456.1 hypothetical protein F0000_25570 [Aquimarina sp. RZ0]
MDDNDLLDGVAFLPFFNETDNLFKNTAIVYYKNNGKELIFEEAVIPETYIYPRIDESVNITLSEY